ncbi:uncharacterized protein C8orf58 homolog isoform X3 [Cricetulus griseus]|uniref:Uncharacterized protein C8orf58 homolog isoform X3 n=1 Tax=Cricetulus griseus TaxID=10029 RepID=A0A9J7J7R9_CRIGR|nr:uncharacterized protein C8orf58 homolog isoform X3 [Cricetulus griseus]XP_027246030.1 uncharacterized protein C8orf58 homolog isoform X3 [Cricetulus griseus]
MALSGPNLHLALSFSHIQGSPPRLGHFRQILIKGLLIHLHFRLSQLARTLSPTCPKCRFLSIVNNCYKENPILPSKGRAFSQWGCGWFVSFSPLVQDTPPQVLKEMLPTARNAGGDEGSLPSLILTLLTDGAFEDLAQGCVVPGVTCTYRRIPDKTHGCSLDFGEGQMPLLKLASQDSGMEMVVGDSPLATLSGLSQDSLNLEPTGSPELPSVQLDRLRARRKLDQVLERSQEFPSLSGQRRHSLQLLSKPVGGVPIFAGELESTEAATELEEAKVVGDVESGALTCLPGQGLRYLEHLCLVLEQMARLQQLYLQLQTQRPSRDPQEEELALALSSSSHSPDNRMQGHKEQLSQTRDLGAEAASLPEVGVLIANAPRLPEALLESTHTLPSSQGHKQDVSHWDKVKVLLNRIRWRSPRLPEPPAPPDGSGPRMEFTNLSERIQYHSHRKTFMPTLVVKKPRAKNLSV